MTKIQVDGKDYDVTPKKNLLETCLSIGLDIPHFCFHPALGSVGACRLCAVKKFKDHDDKKGRIVMSCMEPVTEGMIVSIDDPEAKAFRAAVIESLMTNHPHDCPVCDEGGECHLQDMTVMTGHNYRRFDFKKRTYTNQNLGPFIKHEMNRCIQCYRCVRFYKDYAGGKDLNVFASHNNVYFGRHEEGTLESVFSGNLVEVCPTGVFTDKPLSRHFTRKWDLTNAPSICVHCSVGCNTIISERYGSLRRVMSRYNGAVNGYFTCDRGRFGYEFVNSDKRIKNAGIRLTKNEPQEPSENSLVYSELKDALSKDKKVVGIGSPRASLESNFALTKLVGKRNFFHGISGRERLITNSILSYLQDSGIKTPSLKQMEMADAVLILGEDLLNTAPMIALAVRQASRNAPNEAAGKKGIPLWNDEPLREMAQSDKSPVFIATPFVDGLDEITTASFRGTYTDIADLGSAIASSINERAPESKMELSENQKLAIMISESLKAAKNPLIISGITSGYDEVVLSAINIANSLLSFDRTVMFSMVLPECNSMGVAFMPGGYIEDLFSLTEENEIDTLVILENDLYRRADSESIDHLFERSRKVIVLDHLMNATTLKADILLPAAPFSESQGTLVNNEGRAQRHYKAILAKDQVKESWEWINELIMIRNNSESVMWNDIDEIISSMAIEIPAFSKIEEHMPLSDLRMLNAKIPRQTIRNSGRTAINAQKAVGELRVTQDSGSPLAFSMEGRPERPPSSLVPFYWSPGWNSVQAMNTYLNEPKGSMQGGDPGIRLIEPMEARVRPYFNFSTQPLEVKKDELTFVPAYRIFGSEELSSASESIVERIDEPFVLLNQKDAEKSGLAENDLAYLEVAAKKIKVKVIIENSIAGGIAGLSVSLPGMQFIEWPCFGKLIKI